MRNPGLEEKTLVSIPNPDQLFQQLAVLAETEEQEKKPYSLKMIAPVLNIVFSHLNHLKIEFNPNLDQEPYAIILAEQEKQLFTRRVFHSAYDEETGTPATFTERGLTELPVFFMMVEIGPKFNVVTDLPEFTQQIQTLHNEQMRGYGLVEGEPVYINTNRHLAEYWRFMADRLSVFVDSHIEELRSIGPASSTASPALGESVLLPTVRVYGELCGLFAEGFSSAGVGANTVLTQEVDNTPWLELAWQQTEKRLLATLKGLQEKGKNLDSRLVKEPERFIRTLVSLTTHHAQHKMIEELNTQARSVFFHHCEAELWRKAGLGDIWDRLRAGDDVAEVSRTKTDDKKFIEFIEEYFPKSKDELLVLKRQLQENKRAQELETDRWYLRELQRTRVLLQITLINKLRALVFSEKLFSYELRSYSFSDAIDHSEVNCMVRAELFHQFYGYYCEEPTLAMMEIEHVVSVAKLADGTLISLDNLKLVDESQLGFNIGNHKDLYISAIINQKANELMRKQTAHGVEILYRETIRLVPKYAMYRYNLANLISNDPSRIDESEKFFRDAINLKSDYSDPYNALAAILYESPNPSRLKEAEELWREAIRLDPINIMYLENLVIFLNSDASREAEVEELLLRLYELDPHSSNRTRQLANFYHGKMKDPTKALQWYEKTLMIMDQVPENSNPDIRKSVVKRITSIKRMMKIKNLFSSVRLIGSFKSTPQQPK